MMRPGMFDGCIPALFVGLLLTVGIGFGLGFLFRGC